MTILDRDVLWISSMSPQLYQIYGKDLIESFQKFMPDSDLWYTYDGNSRLCNDSDRIKSYSLNDSRLLQKFTKKNKDWIPTDQGGDRPLEELSKKNKYNGRWFNWYKKVFTLFIAIDCFNYHKQYRYFIWIDCDCILKQKVEYSLLLDVDTTHQIGYFLGKIRKKKDKGVESGLLSFKLENQHRDTTLELTGVDLIRKWHSIYWNRDYLKYKRWDDGYLLKILLYQHLTSNDREKYSIDYGIHSKSRDTHVIKGCHIWNYIEHRKGNNIT